MLGGGFLNSRLAVRIRQKDGLSYGVGSQLTASPLDESGAFTTFAIYAPQNAAKLEAAFREEIAARAQGRLRGRRRSPRPSPAGCSRGRSRGPRTRALARTLAVDLYLDRTLAWDAELEKKVEALTGEQIQAAMRKYLDPAKMTIVKAGDFANAAGCRKATRRRIRLHDQKPD